MKYLSILQINLQPENQMDLTGEAGEVTISFLDLALKGGWIMVPIVLLSIIAVYIFFERYIAIQSAGKEDHSFMQKIKDYIHNGKIDSAVSLCQATDSPVARMIEKGVNRIGRSLNDINAAIENVDVPTVLFFLGILLAVASLQSAGHLRLLAGFLDEKLGNIYAINIAIGLLSAIVDNVPLVAGAQGMYPLIMDTTVTGYNAYFVVDGQFWQFLAYCAGTGGSILIIGSAAGVAAMGLEKIDFIWYMKKISLLALFGYLAGALVYYLMFGL